MIQDQPESKASKLLYCGSEGVSPVGFAGALLRRAKGMPAWEQFSGRVVLPTFLGRVAIRQLCEIWQLNPGDEVLMPAYNCGTEVDPFLVHGCKVVLYRVDPNARIDADDIVARRTPRTKIVYVTHYFGWPQDLRELTIWCRKEGLRLVEDCALALFSAGPEGPLGLKGDAAIFSLGKFLPAPAGGVLTLRENAEIDLAAIRGWPKKETMKRTLNLLRKGAQRDLERLGFYSTLRKLIMSFRSTSVTSTKTRHAPDMPADYYFDEELERAAMPWLSARLLAHTDVNLVKKRRRENYLALGRELASTALPSCMFEELPAGTCPLAFPIMVPATAKSTLVNELGRYGVSIYPFWEGYHRSLDWSEFPEARYLKDNAVTLPVNQSLTVKHMSFIASLVKGFLHKSSCVPSPAAKLHSTKDEMLHAIPGSN